MKWTVFIAAAVLTCACGGPQRADTTGGSGAGGTGSNPSPGASPPTTSGGTAGTMGNNTANQVVTLEGCLRGSGMPNATGTTGTATGSRPSGGTVAGDVSTSGSFTLMNARPVSNETSGSGANGAGGSGGPLVSGISSYDLDSVPMDARSDVDKQVRVTGRLDMTATGGAGSASGVSGATSGSPSSASGATGSVTSGGSAASNGTAGSGTGTATGAGAGAGSGSGAGDVSAFGAGSSRDLGAGRSSRRLTVETVQVIAQSCTAR